MIPIAPWSNPTVPIPIFAADVAYFQDKFDREFKRMVYVLGADHSGYAKRLKAVATAVAGDAAELDVMFCQLVKLLRDGKPVTMGKRAGNFITLRDVVGEVGRDAVRFMMLYRKPEAPLDFDFAKVTEQSKDNPGVLRPDGPRASRFDVSQGSRRDA